MPITCLERFNKGTVFDSETKWIHSSHMSEVVHMSDRSKKGDEELQLMLLAVTEDPTYQGNQRKDNKRVFDIMMESDGECWIEPVAPRTGTLH